MDWYNEAATHEIEDFAKGEVQSSEVSCEGFVMDHTVSADESHCVGQRCELAVVANARIKRDRRDLDRLVLLVWNVNCKLGERKFRGPAGLKDRRGHRERAARRRERHVV
jgi:hypothetical protein